MMHPLYELDHINSVFHQNYRDAYLDHCVRPARTWRTHRIATFAGSARRWTGAILIGVGGRLQGHSISDPSSVSGEEIGTTTA